MLQYDELQLCNVIRMYPVFRRLADKILLASPSCTITFDRVSPCSYEVVKLGELDDEGIVVVLEERFCFESCSEDWLEMPLCLFLPSVSEMLSMSWASRSSAPRGAHIMLFDDLLKAGVIQLRKLC